MSRSVIAGMVLLLSATSVVGSGDDSPADCATECVSQQELAAVKAEMERKVDQLHSQLHYWQNVTVNILKDHYASLNTAPASECSSVKVEAADLESIVHNITQSNQEIKADLESIVFNITQSNQKIKDEIKALNKNVSKRLNSLEDTSQSPTGQCPNDMTGSFLNPAHNCSHVKRHHPMATSGYHWLQSSPGYAVRVFCDMERVCGCDDGGGGWMRVADINMTRPNENCPAGFRKVTASGKTMCGGQSSRCISTTFSSHGLQYSRVCGKIIGYQFATTDGIIGGSIDNIFVDGIVLSHGSPRNHIWTFSAGHGQYTTGSSSCPCNGDSYSGTIPPYVGNDYFCDSGHRYNTNPPYTHLTNDPLWDGAGCVSGSCCTFNSPPWFCKNLSTPTTDDIELRLCIDQALSDEDVLFETVELYIQ